MTRERYYKTGRGRDELNGSQRAVATATGRGFKSCHADFLSGAADKDSYVYSMCFNRGRRSDRSQDRMKFLLAIISIALSFSLPFVGAQEPPLPAKTETPSPSPSPVGTRPQLNIPEIPLLVEPPNLVPDSSPTMPRPPLAPALAKTAPALSQLDAAFQRSPLGQAAEEQRLHLEWRQLQNRAAHDPKVVAAKAATTTAKTDLEKRARLRAYYDVYYAHMQALASSPEIKNYLDGRKAAVLESLAQHRVRPSPAPQPSPAD